VDFRVKVGGKGIAVISGVAVEDVNVLDLVKVVFLGIGGKHPCHARVEAAAQQGGDTGFLKFFPVGPLPAVFKFSGILRLIVGGIHIVDLGGKAGVHDGQVLIGQSQVNYHIRLDLLDEGDEGVHVIGVYLGGGDFGLAAGKFLRQRVAFGFSPAGDADFFKDVAVLTAFVDGYTGYAAAADDECFSHNTFSFPCPVVVSRLPDRAGRLAVSTICII